MEKLFSDSEIFTKERPTKITKQQEEKMYIDFAQEIIDSDWSDDDLDDIVSDLKKINFNDSGYEIAKELEGYNMKSIYEIDTDFIEFLEGLNYEFNAILNQNIKDWVKAHNPQPKYKIGNKILVSEDLNRRRKKEDVFFITGINEKMAYYTIHEEKDFQGGYIFNYEVIEEKCLLID